MAKINLEKRNIYSVIKEIEKAEGKEIVLVLGKDPIFNPLDLRILRKEARRRGKKVSFEVQDEAGKELLARLGQGPGGPVSPGPSPSQKPSLSKKELRKKRILKTAGLLGGGILVLGILGFFLFFWFPQAHVVLSLESSPLTKTLEVVVDPDVEKVLTGEGTIPGSWLEAEKEELFTGETTGEKTVGEKAKGKVEIRNYEGGEITLDQGTVLEDEKTKLKFALSEAVTVSPGTVDVKEMPDGDRVTTETPGKKKVQVVAEDIGEKYNLPQESEFSFPDLKGRLEAKALKDFTGGESRKVRVVTEEDRKNLLVEGREDLEGKIRASLAGEKAEGQKLAGDLRWEITKKEFSKKVEEEGETIDLSLGMKGKALSYFEEDLNQVAQEKLKNLVPQGFRLFEEPQIELLEGSEEKEKVKLSLKAQAQVVPVLDRDQIKKDLRGKPSSWGKAYISDLSQSTSFHITLRPPYPGPLRRFPQRLENIKIEVRCQ
ncbi:MAG: hypothetical protein U9R03_00010 [Candidatus Aerophobetes bacterium]|nr:hypothetical protein [Candidatus Aerophobetes bacterium]